MTLVAANAQKVLVKGMTTSDANFLGIRFTHLQPLGKGPYLLTTGAKSRFRAAPATASCIKIRFNGSECDLYEAAGAADATACSASPAPHWGTCG
jgi:hypothetical protein